MKGLLILLASMMACVPHIELADRYHENALQTRVQVRSAPLIFVGTVIRVERVGEPQRANRVPSLPLQLYRATCHVELGIRGTVPESLDFWYFGPAPESGMVGFPKFWLQAGQRRIFFATKQGSTYRSIGDYLDYTEWVHSGKPTIATSSRDSEAGRLIARVMLTPGLGMDEEEFAGSLVDAKVAAEAFSTRDLTSELPGNHIDLNNTADHNYRRVVDDRYRRVLTRYSGLPIT
jgi:hypothetical protein